MTQINGKWPKYMGNGLPMWDMAQYMGNDLVIWTICGKRLKYVSNDLDMSEMPKICGKQLRYV